MISLFSGHDCNDCSPYHLDAYIIKYDDSWYSMSTYYIRAVVGHLWSIQLAVHCFDIHNNVHTKIFFHLSYLVVILAHYASTDIFKGRKLISKYYRRMWNTSWDQGLSPITKFSAQNIEKFSKDKIILRNSQYFVLRILP